MRVVLAAALAAAVTLPGLSAALACTNEAIAELARRGVARDMIGEVDVHRESNTEGGTQGYIAWVTLRGCQGYAVVQTDTRCRPIQVYTTRDCRIQGVANY